jgi:hypothetical protein
MWEEQLADPREAADAWRRVLRMKQGDTEATAGLERSKSNMLKKPEPGAEREAYAPPKLQTNPPGPQSARPEPKKVTDPAPAPPATERDDSTSPHKPDHLAASLRAALAPEPDEEHDAPAPQEEEPSSQDERPRRPEGLFFRSSPEEATLSAPQTQPEVDRLTKPADEEQLEAIERTFAPETGPDDLGRTQQGAGLDFLDSTLARPPQLQDTGENAAMTEPANGEGEREAQSEGQQEEDFEEEVIIADDLAEMLDAEDEGPATEPPPEEPKSKRSIPPPIPRH